jgi:hypothetical protein
MERREWQVLVSPARRPNPAAVTAATPAQVFPHWTKSQLHLGSRVNSAFYEQIRASQTDRLPPPVQPLGRPTAATVTIKSCLVGGRAVGGASELRRFTMPARLVIAAAPPAQGDFEGVTLS